ncbi:MAG TPA: S26 family signal peptidase [Euzebyales bacterium]|nr:S26 family signal peptidase [Euzebyales bacterium]
MKILAALVAASTTAALWWARRHLVRVTVVGQSMQPTLDHGDVVLVRRTAAHALHPGQLVVAEQPAAAQRWDDRRDGGPPGLAATHWMVKRIAALRVDDGPAQGDGDLRPSLPPGTVYLLGDNLQASEDSRNLGPWPIDRLLGVVVCRLRASGSADLVAGPPPPPPTGTPGSGPAEPGGPRR